MVLQDGFIPPTADMAAIDRGKPPAARKVPVTRTPAARLEVLGAEAIRIQWRVVAGFLLVIIPFFRPNAVNFVPELASISSLFAIWLYLAFPLAVLYVMANLPFSRVSGTLLLFLICLAMSTALMDGSWVVFFVDWLGAGVCALFIGVGLKHYPREVVRSLALISFVLVGANLASILAFSEGLYNLSVSDPGYWLLGHKNGFARVLILGIVVGFLDAGFDARGRPVWRGRLPLLIAMSLITVFLAGSATGVVLVPLCLVLVSLGARSGRLRFVLSPSIIFAAYVVLSALLVVFSRVEIFTYLVESVLGRSLTLTGRTLIWQDAWGLIADSPVVGHGALTKADLGIVLNGELFSTTHNALLDVLVFAGTVGATVYFALLLVAVRELGKHRGTWPSYVLSIGLGCLLVNSILEPMSSSAFFVVVILAGQVGNVSIAFPSGRSRGKEGS